MSEEGMKPRQWFKNAAVIILTLAAILAIGGTAGIIIANMFRAQYTLIQVCEIETGMIVIINQGALDRERYSTNLLDCASAPDEHDYVPGA